MKDLKKDFVRCLEQIIGKDCYLPTLNRHRLASGKPVYRVAGSYGLSVSNDGKIWLYNEVHKNLEITRDNYQESHAPFQWEFLVLERGQEEVAKLLREGLAARGHLVDVTIGAGRSDYASSIVIRPLAGSIPDDSDTLGELAAIADELTAVHTTIDGLVRRLCNLLTDAAGGRA